MTDRQPLTDWDTATPEDRCDLCCVLACTAVMAIVVVLLGLSVWGAM